MFLFVFSLALTVISNVVYHLAQKSTPGGLNPILALAVTYATALAACLIYLAIRPPEHLGAQLRQVNWTSFVLGIAIIGLELGFLLAYRAGWNISLAGLVSNVIVGLVLLPVGLLLFQEKLTPLNLAGVVVCIAGLVMINWR